MAIDPEAAVLTRLEGVDGLTSVGPTPNLFRGPRRPHGDGVPLPAVFVHCGGGPIQRPYLGNSGDFAVSAVQVFIRGDRDQYSESQARGKAILLALHRAALPGVVSCVTREPQPQYLGQDDNGCHHWTVTAELGEDRSP
jgi:hypothetical protein